MTLAFLPRISRALAPLSWSVAALLPAQDKPGATEKPPPASASRLAVSSQGKPVGPVDLVIAFEHAAKVASPCRGDGFMLGCEDPEHWRMGVRTIGMGADDGARTSFGMDDLDALLRSLQAFAAAWGEKHKEAAATFSTPRLSIRVPPDAPFGAVHTLLAVAAAAPIERVEFAVADAAGRERRLPVPLPRRTKTQLGTVDYTKEIRVLVLRERKSSEFLCLLWGRVETGPDAGARLKAKLREAAEAFANVGLYDVPGVIDAQAEAPWQTIVGIIDAMRDVGLLRVQFAKGPPPWRTR